MWREIKKLVLTTSKIDVEEDSRVERKAPLSGWKGSFNQSSGPSHSNLHDELFQTSFGTSHKNRKPNQKSFLGTES